MNKGNFTLPGESGYEDLTFKLANRWGADVIRDSDGTKLSPEILQAGFGIYSTICPIREHNQWIKSNLQSRQQTFLCTPCYTATETTLSIDIMQSFFAQQFEINDSPDAFAFWQVYNRTTNTLLSCEEWQWNKATGFVTINATAFHQYTVSFIAFRIWEEISMYNHVTNNWNKEHLMQLNPYDPKAQEYLCNWLTNWCKEHEATTVVRFTSLFYNFAWIWGSNARNSHLFTDWASYDFTICPQALTDFEKEYGYKICAEDFVRQGKYNATHCVPSQEKLDWMEFIGNFVRKASKQLVDIVHAANKKAYVFYDDSWVGLEPYNGHFKEFGFDGIIKCVFSGFEVRLCANVPCETHEIRFHPYLFPVGLGGAPTFAKGGNPSKDAFNYWMQTRRALLRDKIERAGLGGYLHLVEEYPAFADAMDVILNEFRTIGSLHTLGKPALLKPKIAILTAWGSLRTWTVSGHFHETSDQVLIHILESLSGLAFNVEFISFEDVAKGNIGDADVIINAGGEGTAWSGGQLWNNEKVMENITKWAYEGGVYLGFGQPSATRGNPTYLRMAHVLGLDIDNGENACHGKWQYTKAREPNLIPEKLVLNGNKNAYLTSETTRVLEATNGEIALTANSFGKGKGVYCASYTHTAQHTKLLQNLLLWATNNSINTEGTTSNAFVECSVYPLANKLVLINNSDESQSAKVNWSNKEYSANLQPYAMSILNINEE